MKKFPSNDFKASGATKLADIPTRIDAGVSEKKIYKLMEKIRKKNSALQELMYESRECSLLVCLQGMDTSGKDGLIREVFKDFNSRGVEVHSFKKPSDNELLHGYLWRHYLALPEKGKFGIFNRSHYENVLISRVHPEILLNEKLPGIEKVSDVPPDFWKQRYDQINNFEDYLAKTGTIVVKFFLHISKEEQKKRLLDRLNETDKRWKFSPQDLVERNFWDAYMESYEDAIQNTSTEAAPWYILPSDDKDAARLLATQVINEILERHITVSIPVTSAETEVNIEKYKGMLESEVE